MVFLDLVALKLSEKGALLVVVVDSVEVVLPGIPLCAMATPDIITNAAALVSEYLLILPSLPMVFPAAINILNRSFKAD